jgi:hypothetical protein
MLCKLSPWLLDNVNIDYLDKHLIFYSKFYFKLYLF